MQNRLNITEYCLNKHAQEMPNQSALIIVDKIGEARSFSYGELYKNVCQLTSGLRSLQLPKGTVVSIQANDAYDIVLFFLSAIAADLVPITILISISNDELIYILHHSATKLFIQLSTNNTICLPNGCQLMQVIDFNQLKKYPPDEINPTTLVNDPAFIFYTSGSAGKPKGVLHAQHTILGRLPSLIYWLTIKNFDLVMQTDNLCWTYSMFTGLLDPLLVGATALIFNPVNQSSLAEDSISGETWLELIDTYHVTIIASTPDIYNTILNANNIIPRSLRMAGSAGAALSEIIQNRWQNKFHFPIYTALGMSELSTFISTGEQFPYRKNTLGKIQPGRKVTLLPLEDGYNTVPDNTIGMLAIHKEELGFMLGYINEPQNQISHYRGDWFLTQDLVSKDEHGYIHYYGRADSIIKIDGGFRVSPIEIETVLKQYDQLYDVACGAILDQQTNTYFLVAYIMSHTPSQSLADQIFQFLSQHLSDYKIPKYIYFVESLPYNNRNKLMRHKLTELKPIFIFLNKKLQDK